MVPTAGSGVFRDTYEGAVTASVVVRGDLRHAGLGLPVVSPDGRWVASLEAAGGPETVDADAPLTGRGLGGVSLWVRSVDENAPGPAAPGGAPFGAGALPVALAGASSPAWASDGTLWFVSHAEGGDALVRYEPRSGRLTRLAAGVRRVHAPAPLPGAVVVAGHGGQAEDSLLFRIDLGSRRAEPGPPLGPGGRAQCSPVARGGIVLFVELREDAEGEALPAVLRRWDPAEAAAVDVGELTPLASVFDAEALLAGVPDPLAPEASCFLFFDPLAEPPGLRRLPLAGGPAEAVAAGGTAAVWAGADRLVASVQPARTGRGLAKEPGLRLIDLAAGASGSITLLPGDWAPLWAGSDAAGSSVLAVAPGERPDRLKLVQLYVVDGG